jgi:hypothetical protein
MKESQNMNDLLPFLFLFILSGSETPMYQENHMKKGSHHVEPRTYYKKANPP